MKKIFALLFILTFSAPVVNAQIMSRGDLFGPGAPPAMVGIEFGVGKHTQQGSFQASCGCTFDNGDGTGFMGALLFELPLDYQWAVGITAGIDFKNTSSSASLNESAIVQDQTGTIDTLASLGITRTSAVSTTYLNIGPYVQYQFFRMGPFVQGGIDAGFLLSSKFSQDRNLDQTSTTAHGTTLNNLRFQNGTLTEPVDSAQAIPGVSGLRLGIVLSAGYHIQVSDRSVLTPLVSYDFPLTTISTTNATGWKIGSLYASAELKFRMD